MCAGIHSARGVTGDDARMGSRGPTVRDPGCLPKKMAPLRDGRTSCPLEGGYKTPVESNSPSTYILENLCPHKGLYTHVHRSTIHNAETTQLSINRRMDEQNMHHPYNGILLTRKEE